MGLRPKVTVADGRTRLEAVVPPSETTCGGGCSQDLVDSFTFSESTLAERANPLDTFVDPAKDAVACHRELLNQQREEP